MTPSSRTRRVPIDESGSDRTENRNDARDPTPAQQAADAAIEARIIAIEDRSAEAARRRPLPYLGEAIPIGLIGAAAVAVYILVVDALAGSPLGTPNALGASLILGEPFALDAAIRPGLVFGYTLLHGFAFIAIAAGAVSSESVLAERGMSLALRAVSSAVGANVAVGSGGLVGGTAVLAAVVGVGDGLVQATAVNKISPSKMV